MNAWDELRRRGMVHDATDGVAELLATGPITAYTGFDPTAPSLHVGSLLPIMALVHLQRYGHRPIAVVGGGTGMIGDPSGRSAERPLLAGDELARNLAGIRSQLEKFLDFSGPSAARLVNNADWLSTLHVLDFLRETGKHFTVNLLMQKESVRRRIEGEGISFTEFSYVLLQAYDYLHLYDTYGCVLQMGGSDQWGNITAGVELIRRKRGGKAHALVHPLVTTTAGRKFGKTEGGTVWLDPGRTSPFRFYQFWLNTDDRDVPRYLRYFTLLDEARILELESSVLERPAAREAQRVLAREITLAVHGETALARAEQATAVLFGGADFGDMRAGELLEVFAEVPSWGVSADRLGGGLGLVEAFVESGLVSSRSEARRLLESGGAYLNNRRIEHADAKLGVADLIEGQVAVIRKGKKDYAIVRRI